MTGTRKDIVVVDLGGSTIKVGFAGDADPSRCASPAASLPPIDGRNLDALTNLRALPLLTTDSVVPNCVAKPKGEKRSYIADEINQVKDISSLNLRRPVDRGYVVNWDLQRDILDHVFKKVLKINPKNCHLVITEAPFNLPALAAEQDECIFEKFGFKSALICPPSLLALTYHLARSGRVRIRACRRDAASSSTLASRSCTPRRCSTAGFCATAFDALTSGARR